MHSNVVGEWESLRTEFEASVQGLAQCANRHPNVACCSPCCSLLHALPRYPVFVPRKCNNKFRNNTPRMRTYPHNCASLTASVASQEMMPFLFRIRVPQWMSRSHNGQNN